jgi:carbonic anhydrase/acetyltransferase-like protein (isoleucine patch superfamily)
VGDNSLIGMGAIVLNDAVIGRDCIIGAGSLVTGGTVIPDGSVAFGNPARVRKETGPEGAASNRRNAEFYRHLAEAALEKDHL